MEEPREHTTTGEPDETLVTPRFDEEETVLAQPVVPIDAAAADEAPPRGEPSYAAARPAAQRAPRNQWPLALILVSALVGSVIGGTGLYFFQKHRRAAASTRQEPAAAPAAAEPSPTVEQAAEVAPVESAATVPVAESRPDPVEAAEPPVEEEPEREERDAEDAAPRAARPPAREEAVREEAPRRGKKGDHDAEVQRRERNTVDAGPPAGATGGARRVDSIVYPTRREERRSQRQAERRARRAERQADRLRAIFEGEPE